MAYIIWALIGVVVAVVMGAGPFRRTAHPAVSPAVLAGGFGAVIGGIIGDGLPLQHATQINIPSILGALLGALIFCIAIRERTSDTEA